MSTEDTLLRANEELFRCRVSINWLTRQLMSPPEGWYTFGYHAQRPPVPELEFWGQDEDGDPLWERPVQY
jgi:hypothetical protein